MAFPTPGRYIVNTEFRRNGQLADRLRRFRRPASAHEILHPPLRARLGQYSYLTTVAAAAIAIGIGLTEASYTTTAQRGMNGTLAWTESAGMPMRPTMSTMMTTEIPPADAAEADVHVQVSVPAGTRPGVPARVVVTVTDTSTGRPVGDLSLTHSVFMHLIATRTDLGTFAHGVPALVVVTVTDTSTGRPVSDLALTHSVFMHLIATRADLATFAHVHPEPTGTAGELAVEMTFPTSGRYIVNTEFRRNGQMADIHDRQLVTIAGQAPAPHPVTPGPRTITVDGVRVELHGHAQVGTTSDLTFRLSDARTGQPLRNLQPYLAAAGHIVIMRADGQTFAHEHADVRDSSGHPVFALPGTTFGPDLPVHVHFDTAGTYRLWGQFRLSSGQVITAPFTVQASMNR